MSGGRWSRDKGARFERKLTQFFQSHGFAATKISGMYRPGHDIDLPLLNFDRRIEVKIRARAFNQFYQWLKDADVLVIRGDRQRPLVVVPLDFAIEVAAAAERGRR
jgi:hypothetical protein